MCNNTSLSLKRSIPLRLRTARKYLPDSALQIMLCSGWSLLGGVDCTSGILCPLAMIVAGVSGCVSSGGHERGANLLLLVTIVLMISRFTNSVHHSLHRGEMDGATNVTGHSKSVMPSIQISICSAHSLQRYLPWSARLRDLAVFPVVPHTRRHASPIGPRSLYACDRRESQ